jgi:hypothetical protein
MVDPRQNTFSGTRILSANVEVQRIEWQTIHLQDDDAFYSGPGLGTAAKKEGKYGKTP